MISFKQYITEAYMPRLKGWGNSKTGKLELTPIKGKLRPYHQEFVANNLGKFKLKKKDVIDYISNTKKDAEKIFNQISDGKIDRDNAFGDLLRNEGWYPLVFDKGINSIGDYYDDRTTNPNPKMMLKIATEVDKTFSDKLWDEAYFPKVEVAGKTIYNKYDWEQYLKSGRIGSKTDIGNTMAQFREETNSNENL